MKDWLTPALKVEVKSVFEKHYNRKLTEKEVIEIANNLSKSVQLLLNSRLKNYGKRI